MWGRWILFGHLSSGCQFATVPKSKGMLGVKSNRIHGLDHYGENLV